MLPRLILSPVASRLLNEAEVRKAHKDVEAELELLRAEIDRLKKDDR